MELCQCLRGLTRILRIRGASRMLSHGNSRVKNVKVVMSHGRNATRYEIRDIEPIALTG